jgi:signal peptidase II
MPAEAAPQPAARVGPVTRFGLIAYAIAAVAVVLDQASKAWILYSFHLPEKGQVVVSPIFRLSMVWNSGVSYGLLQDHGGLGRWLLVLFAAVVIAALAGWAARAQRLLSAAAVGLVMGGAIGNNLIDRVRFGAVVDFLDFSGIGFKWVFNVADSAITVGVVLLLIEMLPTGAASPTPGTKT